MTKTAVLGIESSCDECSVAVVEFGDAGPVMRGLATFSQIRIHQPYGGVVPEIASRHHLETVLPLLDQALAQAGYASLAQIDVIAVTSRPGLIGALLVGVSAAKALAYAASKPLVAVNHLEGHAVSPFIDRDPPPELAYPLCLALVSGGHSQLHVIPGPPSNWALDVLEKSRVGRSLDDAAGEAFDKTAKLLGLPYPGGRWIDEKSQGGNPAAFKLPRPLPARSSRDFSFSGMKTAVAQTVAELKRTGELERRQIDLCASVQEAIVDMLVRKIEIVIEDFGCQSLAVVGGVAANRRLRTRLDELLPRWGVKTPLLVPHARYCTDQAAMIAAAGGYRFRQGHFFAPGSEAALTLNAQAYA